MKQTEQYIQDSIRIALSDYGIVFRTNAGSYWQGVMIFDPGRQQNILTSLTRINGLPEGFSDLLFVGKDGRVAFIEVKSARGTVRPEQERFLAIMREMGHRAGVARSVTDAMDIVNS